MVVDWEMKREESLRLETSVLRSCVPNNLNPPHLISTSLLHNNILPSCILQPCTQWCCMPLEESVLANNPFCYFNGVKSRSIRIWIDPSSDWSGGQYPPFIDVSLCFVLRRHHLSDTPDLDSYFIEWADLQQCCGVKITILNFIISCQWSEK